MFPALGFFGVFFGMVRQRRHHEVRIRSSHPILASVVRLAPVEGAWSHVPDISQIWSVFVIVCVVSGQYLIYGSHYRQCLVYWSIEALAQRLSILIYYSKLYYNKLCPAPVMVRRRWRRTFGSY
jgi:hypothetical protein